MLYGGARNGSIRTARNLGYLISSSPFVNSTLDVGGNAEVVCRDALGSIVPFGDAAALQQALDAALDKNWDRAAIIDYAQANQWDKRVAQLLRAFDALLAAPASSVRSAPAAAGQ